MRRRHRLRRKDIKKRRTFFIIGMFAITFLFASGYAAFSTNLNINAKGNLKQNLITVNKLKQSAVSSGDGLYNNGDGTYTYKGANPDNYLSFEGSTWRILGIDNQGIKIIRDEKLSTEMAYDTANTRDAGSNGAGGTYCNQSTAGYGCNAWAATSHLVGTPAEFVNGSNQGTVTEDSSLNTYLNGDYYTNTLHSNSNIISGTFNVGPVTYNNNDLAAAKTSEASYQWQGHIALAIPSEYLAANTDQTNCGTESLNNTNYSTCSTTNYLYKSYNWWLVSATSGRAGSVRSVGSIDGYISGSSAYGTLGVRPVLYLSSDVQLTGEGTQSIPYEIANSSSGSGGSSSGGNSSGGTQGTASMIVNITEISSPSNGTAYGEEEIEISFSVTNTGSETLDNIAVESSITGDEFNPTGSLGPGETTDSYPTTYTNNPESDECESNLMFEVTATAEANGNPVSASNSISIPCICE